jgi:hypothetical protein
VRFAGASDFLLDERVARVGFEAAMSISKATGCSGVQANASGVIAEYTLVRVRIF